MGLLDGKLALVTGASRGIGAAVAVRLAQEGARVVVAARTVRPRSGAVLAGSLQETVADVEAVGGQARAIAADLSDAADRVALVSQAMEWGPVDVLVNNAAVTWFGPVADFPAKRSSLMWQVQVEAPFHLAQLVLPTMRSRRSGWICNISSAAARHPAVPMVRRAPGGTVYGMCKAALERFSTGLASEVYEEGIAVNALSPNGVVPTPGTIFHGLTSAEDPGAEPPAIMAEAVLALCSRPAAELSGRVAYSQNLLEELGIPVAPPR